MKSPKQKYWPIPPKQIARQTSGKSEIQPKEATIVHEIEDVSTYATRIELGFPF